MINTNFVEQLKERQAERKLADSEFAELLGISKPTWNMVKSGKRQLGVESLNKIMANFPELTIEIMQYIRSR